MDPSLLQHLVGGVASGPCPVRGTPVCRARRVLTSDLHSQVGVTATAAACDLVVEVSLQVFSRTQCQRLSTAVTAGTGQIRTHASSGQDVTPGVPHAVLGVQVSQGQPPPRLVRVRIYAV